MPPTQKTAARIWKRMPTTMSYSTAAGGRCLAGLFLVGRAAQPDPQGLADFRGLRVDRLVSRAQPPAQRVDLIEEVQYHGERLVIDGEIAAQLDDEADARDIDLVEKIAFRRRFLPHPVLGDPSPQFRRVETADRADDRFEIHHDAIPRRGS